MNGESTMNAERAMDKISMLSLAHVLYGIPYKWGGKTPQGFDCSGFVCELLMSIGKLPNDTILSSRGLYKHFKHLKAVKPGKGCLLFYGKSVENISHVAVAIDAEFMYEAGGGGSTTRSVLDSIRKRAYVRRRRIDRRSDLVAVVDPFMDEMEL